MKNNVLILIAIMMFLNLTAQDKVYDNKGSSHKVAKSKEKLILLPSDSVKPVIFDELKETEKEFFIPGLIATLLPTAIDAIFNSVEKYLENREKSFVGEYATSTSYLQFNNKDIPKITFSRSGVVDGKDDNLINLTINSVQPDTSYPLAFFYVENFELKYSKARTKRGKTSLDYTIEITPQLLKVVHEKDNNVISATKIEKADEIKIDPIKMVGMGFGVFTDSVLTPKDRYQYRTGFFTVPKGHIVAGIQLKIVESNPAKVGAEKILAIFNEYKDEARTVINNYLPENKSSNEVDNGSPVDDSTETVGNK